MTKTHVEQSFGVVGDVGVVHCSLDGRVKYCLEVGENHSSFLGMWMMELILKEIHWFSVIMDCKILQKIFMMF